MTIAPTAETTAALAATYGVGDDAKFTGDRLPAFIGIAHITGMVTNDDGMSIHEAVVAAGLDFTVTTHPVQANVATPNGAVVAVPMDGHYATIRRNPDNTRQPLGIVKGRYQPIQNFDAFAFGQHLADEYGANVVAAAEYGKPLGSRTFLSLRLSETLTVAGKDPHDLYLLLSNSHDGSTGLTAAIVPIRRASMGEVVTSIPHVPQRWTLRHSGDIAGKFEEAVHTMQMVKRWISTYQKISYDLLGTRMNNTEFAAFAERLLPTPRNAGKRSAETWAVRRRTLIDLFENSPTTGFGRGTRYAAVSAVNEYVDHYAAARGGDPQAIRYARNLGGQSVRFKERAWGLLAHS